MKKLIAAAAALLLTVGIAGLTACSGSAEASVASTKSGSELTAAGIKLNLPENWTATVGDKVYEIVLDSAGSGSSSDVESFKKLCEDNGTAYLAYAVNSEGTAVLTLTSLRITPDETTGEILTAGDYARQNHDTAVFSYQASGMYIRNSSFGEEQLADRSGYLSHFELCSDEEVSELILGQSEFTFEQDGKFYSIQTYYHNETAAADVDEILANMTAQ